MPLSANFKREMLTALKNAKKKRDSDRSDNNIEEASSEHTASTKHDQRDDVGRQSSTPSILTKPVSNSSINTVDPANNSNKSKLIEKNKR